ncbi:hypothetical protein M433DRAFT_138208 [Acidomyces richmondensis BFW]|nr:hypothetical protein M433DRAFT_138208 [Acidomyces richmondensis BFW]
MVEQHSANEDYVLYSPFRGDWSGNQRSSTNSEYSTSECGVRQEFTETTSFRSTPAHEQDIDLGDNLALAYYIKAKSDFMKYYRRICFGPSTYINSPGIDKLPRSVGSKNLLNIWICKWIAKHVTDQLRADREKCIQRAKEILEQDIFNLGDEWYSCQMEECTQCGSTTCEHDKSQYRHRYCNGEHRQAIYIRDLRLHNLRDLEDLESLFSNPWKFRETMYCDSSGGGDFHLCKAATNCPLAKALARRKKEFRELYNSINDMPKIEWP